MSLQVSSSYCTSGDIQVSTLWVRALTADKSTNNKDTRQDWQNQLCLLSVFSFVVKALTQVWP